MPDVEQPALLGDLVVACAPASTAAPSPRAAAGTPPRTRALSRGGTSAGERRAPRRRPGRTARAGRRRTRPRSPSNSAASSTSRPRSSWRTCSRSPSLSGGRSSQPASSAAARTASAAGGARALEPPAQPPRGIAVEQRRALERDARVVQHLLEVGQPRVRAREDRASSSGQSSARIAATSAASSSTSSGVRPHDRLRPGRASRAQRLLGAAEPRDEPVRELEHLRRRAVVLLEPEDLRVREPMPASRAGAPGRRR